MAFPFKAARFIARLAESEPRAGYEASVVILPKRSAFEHDG